MCPPLSAVWSSGRKQKKKNALKIANKKKSKEKLQFRCIFSSPATFATVCSPSDSDAKISRRFVTLLAPVSFIPATNKHITSIQIYYESKCARVCILLLLSFRFVSHTTGHLHMNRCRRLGLQTVHDFFHYFSLFFPTFIHSFRFYARPFVPGPSQQPPK